ncbi:MULTISPECIES: RNA polymerase sigma factor [Prevotellaceae]|uniref:RNA polymerase sigma factor n=1 Tax=Prevotellaceae TaxID=171552 RepID=UPI0003D354BC|nr:sigma-70 family RNA polymerase sigma factor [Prevotella phocaeensis]ETD16057.1 hypothetical protein HMPREF1199_02349 [Hoylesella oralis CC98A]
MMEQKDFEIFVLQTRLKLLRSAEILLKDADEAEDAVQDTVFKLWAMRNRLDEYRSVGALSMVVLRRICLNRLRRADFDLPPTVPDTEPSAEQQLIGREEAERVEKLIASLPDKQQTILRMKHADGLGTATIAQLTGISEEAVRQNLSRARRRILKYFE